MYLLHSLILHKGGASRVQSKDTKSLAGFLILFSFFFSIVFAAHSVSTSSASVIPENVYLRSQALVLTQANPNNAYLTHIAFQDDHWILQFVRSRDCYNQVLVKDDIAIRTAVNFCNNILANRPDIDKLTISLEDEYNSVSGVPIFRPSLTIDVSRDEGAKVTKLNPTI